MKSRFRVGDRVRVVNADFFAGQRGHVVHLGNDDVVGILFSDGISCIFHGNTDLELVTD
jgi:hypothetical protein